VDKLTKQTHHYQHPTYINALAFSQQISYWTVYDETTHSHLVW